MDQTITNHLQSLPDVLQFFTWTDGNTVQNYPTPKSRELGETLSYALELSGALGEEAGFGHLLEIHVRGTNQSAVLFSVREANRDPGDPTTVGAILTNSQPSENFVQSVRLLGGSQA